MAAASALRRAAATLLLASGFCALVYEVAWLRMLRLVFGASTAASAAVMAIFLGGLGAGGILFGRRADRSANPLRLYADLETAVAVLVATTPVLVALARTLYVLVGGTARIGPVAGTAVRVLLTALILGPPTVLMGGALPAAVRAIERASDAGRRDFGFLYGANTVGAVGGTLYATFVALELLGTNLTLWSACLLNAAVAVAARRLAMVWPLPPAAAGAPAEPAEPAAAPLPLVLVAAGIAGFAFLLMELVWYRMLAPLLGGSSYTLGLILAVALFGIGAGGLAYGLGFRGRRPTLVGFATSCALEALCLVVPYALGDRVALIALVLRPVGFLGFGALVVVWLLVTALVVLAAALVSGYQLPLLVGLLGRGERGVGRDVGLVYAANTAGAILGALAGGFVLIPVLGAPGAWRAAVLLVLALAAACVVAAVRRRPAMLRQVAVPLALAVVTGALCASDGPTAFWRHSAIGAGRLEASFAAPDDYRRLLADRRRRIVWEADGRESPVALDGWDGYAFLINGKNDGNALGDAPTQVMLGLVPAAIHGAPRSALVIGLGTGSTAGWLAQVSSVEHVDVVELESVVRHVADVCAPVNHDVLRNPKVRVVVGDGREFLFTTPGTYDVIASEPSNPYRAGIASLFTREFYAAAAARLAPGGIFAQWVPAYEVDASTIRTVYATLADVFPVVETWELKDKDLLLMARREAPPQDVARLSARLDGEPYRSALAVAWGVRGVEGLYANYVANGDLAAALRDGTPVNTDDRTTIEFAFARTVGRTGLFDPEELRQFAAAHGSGRPAVVNGAPDWTLAAELRTVRAVLDGHAPDVRTRDAALQHRVQARRAYVQGDLHGVQSEWLAQDDAPRAPMDVAMVAESLAASADPRALPYLDELRALAPPEAEALRARWDASAGEVDSAVEHLRGAFRGFRTFPWTYRPLLGRSLDLAWDLAHRRPDLAGALFDALGEPFAVHARDGQRISTYVSLGLATDFAGRCVAAFASLEPHVPWERSILQERERCYTLVHHPLAARARTDLATFQAGSPARLDAAVPGGGG